MPILSPSSIHQGHLAAVGRGAGAPRGRGPGGAQPGSAPRRPRTDEKGKVCGKTMGKSWEKTGRYREISGNIGKYREDPGSMELDT